MAFRLIQPLTDWFTQYQNRLMVFIASVVLAISAIIVLTISQVATQIITQERGKELTIIARSLAHSLNQTLFERMREVRLLSQRNELKQAPLDGPIVRQQLRQVKNNYPYYAWVGIADKEGIVRTDASDLLNGQSVKQRPWFSAGLKRSYIGDAHEAVLLAKSLPNSTPNEPLRFVDFAMPIYDSSGEVRGVVATHTLWSWVTDVIDDFLPQKADTQSSISAFIINQDNNIIHPFEAINAAQLPADLPANDSFASVLWGNTEYLTSVASVDPAFSDSLGWRIIIRQPRQSALAAVTELQQSVIITGFFALILSLVLSYRIARRFSRPIGQLASIANRIEQGEENIPVTVNSSLYELKTLNAALQGMTHTLIERKHKLEKNNLLLEQRVKQRTQELAEANKELEHLTRHDALTGILNRRAFQDELASEFDKWQRYEHRFSVILLDVDHFKQVNDQHGHAVGDEVLVHLVEVIKDVIRDSDVFARFGGEEFVILLPNTSKDAHEAADKVRQAVANSTAPTVKTVTISAGVSSVQTADNSADAVINRADKAMYAAKNSGRNRVCQAAD